MMPARCPDQRRPPTPAGGGKRQVAVGGRVAKDAHQRWAGLAGDGANHCVPASTLNWMYSCARNGRHEITNLAFMGAAMGVTATNGTNSSSAINRLEDWMDARCIPAAMRARRALEGDDFTSQSPVQPSVFNPVEQLRSIQHGPRQRLWSAARAMSYSMRKDRPIGACGGATAAQRRLLALTPALTPSLKATGAVPLPALAARADTTALQVSGLGRVHVSEGGKVASFDKDGVRIAGSPLDGLRSRPLLKVARSCNTLDDSISGLPAWHT